MLCKLMNKSEEQLRKMLQGLTTSESMDLSQLLLNSPKTPPVSQPNHPKHPQSLSLTNLNTPDHSA